MSAWGVDTHEHGKTVWARLNLADAIGEPDSVVKGQTGRRADIARRIIDATALNG